MNVRLTIDRVVLDSADTAPFTDARLIPELCASLRAALLARADVAGADRAALPVARRVSREHANLPAGAAARRSGLGSLLGDAIANQVWNGTSGL